MFCSNCGHQMTPDQNVCPQCGTKRAGAAATPSFSFPSMASGSVSSMLAPLMYIAAALMLIGTLLPISTVSFLGASQSFSYIEGDGIFVLLAAIAVAALVFFKLYKFASIPAAISLIILFVFSVSDELAMALDLGANLGIGFFVMWLGILAAIALPWLPLEKIFKK